jgi:chromosome partitioning protein
LLRVCFIAIVAAQQIIVPVSCERMAVDGLADLIKHLHTTLWPRYELDQDIRILFTKYQSSTSLSPGIVKSATKIYRDNVLSMLVPHSVAFPRSYEVHQPMTKFAPTHVGTKAYQRLAQWLMQ